MTLENEVEGSKRWSDWRQRRTIVELVLSALVLGGVMTGFSIFTAYVEKRPGVRLSDPVLESLPSIDVTWILFAMVYGGIVLAIVTLLPDPRRLAFSMQVYAAMVAVRILAMYLMPLEPPEGMIVLVDPLAAAGTGAILSKDLFFSGHTATLFLLALTARTRLVRTLFLVGSGTIGVLVLLQHCHYTIDVLAAPFFVYGTYRAVKRITPPPR